MDCPVLEESIIKTIGKFNNLARCAVEPLAFGGAPSNNPIAPSIIKLSFLETIFLSLASPIAQASKLWHSEPEEKV